MSNPKKLTDLQRNWNIVGKVFKDQKPQIVKDSKGNSWFEFAVPQNMQQMELSYKQGGSI